MELSLQVGWSKDRFLPEGWRSTRVGQSLLLELSFQGGWSKDRFMPQGWMLTRVLLFSDTGAESRGVGVRTGFCQKAGSREECDIPRFWR